MNGNLLFALVLALTVLAFACGWCFGSLAGYLRGKREGRAER